MTHVVAANDPVSPTIPKIRNYFKLLQHKLKDILNANVFLTKGLEDTLKDASDKAKEHLNHDLYEGIINEFGKNAFPTTLNEWAFDEDCFLWKFATWIPNERGDVWKGADGYNQKLFDMLCHFYWLINADADVDYPLVKPQEDRHFNKWLAEYAKINGLFLDSPESLTPKSLQSFIDDAGYQIQLFDKNIKHWKTFNEFFYRRYNDTNCNGISPLRPIAAPDSNSVIASPASCALKQVFKIEKNGDIEGIKVKGLKVANVRELLGLTVHAKRFFGGTFVHYFLSPYDYHRFHTPVLGKVLRVEKIPGYVYLNTRINKDQQFEADDSAKNGYEFQQSRGLIIIDTSEPPSHELNNIGLVAVLPIGMAQVSGVGLNDCLEGKIVEKGTEFGMFKFGGSDIIMLFEQAFDCLQFEKKHLNFGEEAATVTCLRN